MTHVYILTCADGSLYVGQTRNLQARIASHNAGTGAQHTRERRPVRLAYAESCETTQQAIRRERQIKGWSRAKKQALIDRNRAELKRLSKRRRDRPRTPSLPR